MSETSLFTRARARYQTKQKGVRDEGLGGAAERPLGRHPRPRHDVDQKVAAPHGAKGHDAGRGGARGDRQGQDGRRARGVLFCWRRVRGGGGARRKRGRRTATARPSCAPKAHATPYTHNKHNKQPLRDVDFVVEAVTENEGVKRAIFQQLDRVSRVIVCSASCCVCFSSLV